jgi:hypothetical protein
MKLTVSWLALALLSGCGATTDVAGGGGGFEGETVMLTGIVRDPDSRPLERARVALHAPDWTQGSPQDTTLTDNQGRYSFHAKANGIYRIEARKDSFWTHRQVETIGIESTFDIPIAKAFRWKARMSASTLQPVRISIYGSSSSAAVEEGAIVLERDPSQSAEWARLDLADGRSLPILLPSLTDSILDLSQAGSILIDDFDGSGTRSKLGAQIGSGWWFALSDSASGGTSQVLPTGVIQDFTKAYSGTSAWQGRSLAVSFTIDTTKALRYAEIGLEMANAGLWIDFSKLDSLSFMAKGSGNVRFQVVTASAIDLATGSGADYAASVKLDPNWTRIVLKASDFAPRSASQSTPASVAFSRVRRLLLISESPVELGLDDLRIHGPGLSDLLPRP